MTKNPIQFKKKKNRKTSIMKIQIWKMIPKMTSKHIRKVWSHLSSVQFSSVQSLIRVWLFATPRIAARQASLSIANSRNSLRLTSVESVMPSSHLILCRPLLLLPPIPPSIKVFSNESTLRKMQIKNTLANTCMHPPEIWLKILNKLSKEQWKTWYSAGKSINIYL